MYSRTKTLQKITNFKLSKLFIEFCINFKLETCLSYGNRYNMLTETFFKITSQIDNGVPKTEKSILSSLPRYSTLNFYTCVKVGIYVKIILLSFKISKAD